MCIRKNVSCSMAPHSFKCSYCKDHDFMCTWVIDLIRTHVIRATRMHAHTFNNLHLHHYNVDPLTGVRFNKNVPADIVRFYRESDRIKLYPTETLRHPVLCDLKLPEPASSATAISQPHTPDLSPCHPPLEHSTDSAFPYDSHPQPLALSVSPQHPNV